MASRRSGETQPDQISAAAAGSRSAGPGSSPSASGPTSTPTCSTGWPRKVAGAATYVAPERRHAKWPWAACSAASGTPRWPISASSSAPVTLTDAQPSQLPDLFYGEETGGVRPLSRHRPRATWSSRASATAAASGSPPSAEFTAGEPDNSFVPPLWASRKIGELTRTARLEGASPAIIEEIRQLGLRYGLLTEYTSFLVLEPGAVRAGPRPRPAGRSGRREVHERADGVRPSRSQRPRVRGEDAGVRQRRGRRTAGSTPAATGCAAAAKRVAGRADLRGPGRRVDRPGLQAGGPPSPWRPSAPRTLRWSGPCRSWLPGWRWATRS